MAEHETDQGRAGGEVDVAGLRELLAAATPGPWWSAGAWFHDVTEPEGVTVQVPHPTVGHGNTGADLLAYTVRQDGADATLIAAAVNALPALLDLAERVRVVEGERDAAWAVAAQRRGEARRYYLAWSSAQMRARDHRARAESAEGAHAALLAKVEALADQIDAGVVSGLGGDRSHTLANISAALRALLDGRAS